MNTILYIGLGLMLFGFIGFLISASMENYYDKKLKDLNKKYNFEYIKIKPKVKNDTYKMAGIYKHNKKTHTILL